MQDAGFERVCDCLLVCHSTPVVPRFPSSVRVELLFGPRSDRCCPAPDEERRSRAVALAQAVGSAEQSHRSRRLVFADDLRESFEDTASDRHERFGQQRPAQMDGGQLGLSRVEICESEE
jgi:hypothetical protein